MHETDLNPVLRMNAEQITSMCVSAKLSSKGRRMCIVRGCSASFILESFLRIHIMENHKKVPAFLRFCFREPCRGMLPASEATIKFAIKHFYDAHFESIVKRNDDSFQGAHIKSASQVNKENKYRRIREHRKIPVLDDSKVKEDSALHGPSNRQNATTSNGNAIVARRTGEPGKDELYRCLLPWCTNVFVDRYARRRHFYTSHSIRKPTAYACGFCGDLFMGPNALFTVCFHFVSRHRRDELRRSSVIRALRYLYLNGDWCLDMGHYDVSYLLGRIGFKFDELIPLWFRKELTVSSSPTLNHLLKASEIQLTPTDFTALGISSITGSIARANNLAQPSMRNSGKREDFVDLIVQCDEVVLAALDLNSDTVDNSFDVDVFFADSSYDNDNLKCEGECAEFVKIML